MAVYKRTYHGYSGPLTDQRWRFLVLPRFTFEQMKKSRLLAIFFMVGLGVPLLGLVAIYMTHSLSLLRLLGVSPSASIQIGETFFLMFISTQSLLSFAIASFGGPGLIAPDVANNGLPLYLARPFSRAEYVLGKASVLIILLSLITWIPGLLLYFFEASFQNFWWMVDHIEWASGLFFGSLVYILVLTCLALALSALVRLKHLGSAVLFLLFFGSIAIGHFSNVILHTRWGSLLNFSHLIACVWCWLFGTPVSAGAGVFVFRMEEPTPVWSAFLALGAICGFCLWMLAKRVRGVEEVK